MFSQTGLRNVWVGGEQLLLYTCGPSQLISGPLMTRRVSKAFVLGAGLGTRLRPLTTIVPKPLTPIFGKPLITFAFDHLIEAGINHFVVNTHHLANQFARQFPTESYRGRRLDLVHEPELLETGGGIKNAQPWLGSEPFLVYSGDILTDVHLTKLQEAHWENENLVTLGLRQTGLANPIAFDSGTGRILDIAKRGGSGVAGTHDFANVSIWSPEIFERIPPKKKISFIPVLADWLREGGKVGGALLEEGRWFNIGSVPEYFEVHRSITANNWRPTYLDPVWPERMASDAQIENGFASSGFSWVGSRARVGANVALHDSVVWPQAQVGTGARLERCIVAGSCLQPGDYQDRVFL